MEALARQSCAEHPDRPSYALCVSCRKMLCHECTTQLEGINYCSACVAAVAAEPEKRSVALSVVLMLVFGLAIAIALARLLVGVGVYIAGML
jgi:hypothetical protein